MISRKSSFKTKVLIPIAAIFAVSILIISWTHYKMLESTVKAKTDETVTMFMDAIAAQINHLARNSSFHVT